MLSSLPSPVGPGANFPTCQNLNGDTHDRIIRAESRIDQLKEGQQAAGAAHDAHLAQVDLTNEKIMAKLEVLPRLETQIEQLLQICSTAVQNLEDRIAKLERAPEAR